jgi:hypothetical protein
MKKRMPFAICGLLLTACGDWSFGSASDMPTESSFEDVQIGAATTECPEGVLLQERCTWECGAASHCDGGDWCNQKEKLMSAGQCTHLDLGKVCGVWHMTVTADNSVCYHK